MNVKITTRHFELTDANRKKVNDKLKRLEKFNHVKNVDIIFELEGSRRKVDMIVKTNRGILKASGENHDTIAAFNEVFKKIEVQVRRLEDKLTTHNGK